MARTNIDIDEVACQKVMQRRGLKTKREAVNYALQRTARELEPMTKDEMLALEGIGWDLDADHFDHPVEEI